MLGNKIKAIAAAVSIILIVPAIGLTGCGDNGSGKTAETPEAKLARCKEASPYGYRVINSYIHDQNNSTQGLVMEGGALYEGTGLKGKSRLLKTDPRTGTTLNALDLAPEYFGEGVTVLGEEVFQLTYTSNLGFVYDRESFALKRTFSYPGEGWGLTNDGMELIMSDGSSVLRFMDPATFSEIGSITVMAGKQGPIDNLNELEYIDGEIYANVWKSSLVVIISPQTGEITGWVDLAELNPDPEKLKYPYVLNGIAYEPASGHLLVTGKCWPFIYEIELIP